MIQCTICNYEKDLNNDKSDICRNCNLRTRHRILFKVLPENFFIDKVTCANYADESEKKYLIKNTKELVNFDIRKLDICDYQMDICNMNLFTDNYFDIFYSVYTLNHVKDNIKALHEINRVLKKDGILILMTFLKKNENTLVREEHKTYGIDNFIKYGIGDYTVYNLNEYIEILSKIFIVNVYKDTDNFTEKTIEDYVFICKKK